MKTQTLFLFVMACLFLACEQKQPETVAELMEMHLARAGGVEAWQTMPGVELHSSSKTEINGKVVYESDDVEYIDLLNGKSFIQSSKDGVPVGAKLMLGEEKQLVYKYSDGKIVGQVQMDGFPPVFKDEVELLKYPEGWTMTVGEWEGKQAFIITNGEENKRIYEQSSLRLLAFVSQTMYGESITSFSDFQKVEGLEIPHTITSDIKKSNYRTVKKVLEVAVHNDFEADLFKEDVSWQKVKVDAQVPAFEVKNYVDSTQMISPETLKGKVVLIDFWATWCKPCLKELPNIEANYEKYHSKGFEVLSISLDEREESYQRFLKLKPHAWLNARDGAAFDSELATTFEIAAIPKAVLIDQNGKIVAVDQDASGNSLGKHLAELLD